jgi:hypothetical protein
VNRCDHGIPYATGCDECEHSLIVWAEELQVQPDCSQRWNWRHYALVLAFVLPAGWAGYLIWRMI